MSQAALIALIHASEMLHGIPPELLVAICAVESNLDPQAVVAQDGDSGRTSYGLCQVQERTARQFLSGVSAKELLIPSVNVYVAGAYLRWQYKRYRSWDRAVVAFNRGSSTGGLNSYHRKVKHAQRILLSARNGQGQLHRSPKDLSNKTGDLVGEVLSIHSYEPISVGDRDF